MQKNDYPNWSSPSFREIIHEEHDDENYFLRKWNMFRLPTQMLRIMRVTSVFLLVFFLHVSAKTSSQLVSISGDDMPLKKVFSLIKQQTDFVVFSNRNDLDRNETISVSAHNLPLTDFLEIVLKKYPLGYFIEDKTIILFRKPAEFLITGSALEEIQPERLSVDFAGVIRNAQTKEVIHSASISVKGSQMGVSSGVEGTFSLKGVPTNGILVFSSIGFASLEVPAKTLSDILNGTYASGKNGSIFRNSEGMLVIELTPKNTDLEKIVVVGYGTQKRKDVTGAIASVGRDEFNPGSNVRPIQQLQGKVAGLVISFANGDPNGDPIIRLRGQASLTGGQTPLIVVDGIPLDDPNQLSYLSPTEIVSYDILKDASASAIYGSRAANGVIMVTTKSGQVGKSKVDYSGLVEIEKTAKKYELLTAGEYKEAIGPSAGYYDKGANTDWFDEITRTGITHSNSLAISGGTNQFTYRASGAYINQRAIVINSGREEMRLNINVEKKALNDKLTIKANLISSTTARKYANYEIFTFATNTPPTYPVYNPDGSYYAYSDWAQMNPVAVQMMETNQSREDFNIMSSSIDYRILNNIKIGFTGALSRQIRQYSYFEPELPGVGNINYGSKSSQNRNSRKGIFHADYDLDINKSSLSATAVLEYNHFSYNSYGASGKDYLVESLENNALQNGNPLYNLIDSYKDEYKLASVLGRVAYNYDSRYYLTASFRRDGSSKFGKNNRWGNFPSISVAWRLNNENFMKSLPWIDELKINAGYGVTGNQDAITPYNTLLSLGGAGNYYDGSTGTFRQQYTPDQNQNKDLKWEERHGKNIGVDFSLFNHLVGGSINVFNDITKNLLFTYSVPVPPFYVETMLANVGTMTNRGLEIQLTANLIKEQKISWTLGGQLTFLKTRIKTLSGSYGGYNLSTDHIPSGYPSGRGYAFNAITYLQEGYTPNVFFLPHFMGVNDEGLQTYDNKKGGLVTSNELTEDISSYIDPSPRFSYGINNTITYQKWSCNFSLRGVSGGKIFDNTSSLITNYTRLPGANVVKEALSNGIRDQLIASDLWLKNGSFLRLDNITLSYDFVNLNRDVDRISLFVTGTNLFVLTKYTGLDPEVNLRRIDVTYGGNAFYPRVRSASIGINVTFN